MADKKAKAESQREREREQRLKAVRDKAESSHPIPQRVVTPPRAVPVQPLLARGCDYPRCGRLDPLDRDLPAMLLFYFIFETHEFPSFCICASFSFPFRYFIMSICDFMSFDFGCLDVTAEPFGTTPTFRSNSRIWIY